MPAQTQSPGSAIPAGRYWPWAAFAAYLACHLAFLYHPGLVRYDDFAYLRGVIATLAQGKPITHDWLEPYSATLSGLCALAYRATGNFPLSTWGLEAAFTAANFVLLHRLLRLRLDRMGSACVAFLLATQPMYWYKCAEFTSNPFTCAFVLAALLAWTARRYGLFYVAAFLAAANRQNSVALLILPACACLTTRGRPRLGHTFAIAVFLAGMAALHAVMNRTLAQSVGIYATFDAARCIRILQSLAVGVALVPAFLSVFGALLGAGLKSKLAANLRAPAPAACATVFFLLIPAWGGLPLIDFQAPLIGSADRGHALQYALLIVVPASYWFLDWHRLRPHPALALCLAYPLIGSLKGILFDAYLIDIGLAALFYRLVAETEPGSGKGRPRLAIALATAHLAWAYAFSILAAKEVLSNRVYESLERSGTLNATDMTDGTFGYLGWKLFDAFAQEGRPGELSGFLRYVRRDRTRLQTEVPWRRSFKDDIPAGGRVLDSGTTVIGGYRLRYRMLLLHPDTEESISPDGRFVAVAGAYRVRPFPLNKQEWSDLIEAETARKPGAATSAARF